MISKAIQKRLEAGGGLSKLKASTIDVSYEEPNSLFARFQIITLKKLQMIDSLLSFSLVFGVGWGILDIDRVEVNELAIDRLT